MFGQKQENIKRTYATKFITQLAKHEAGHLFKDTEHHITRLKGQVDNHDYAISCNRLWSSPTTYICKTCSDSIKDAWKLVEKDTGERFFK